MSRVILVGGQGGAGASTFARASVEAVRDDGETAALLNVATPDLSADDLPDLVAGALGRVLVDAGADPMPSQAWSDLPEARLLRRWLALERLAGEVEVAVVDAGSLADLRDLVALPSTLLRLVAAASTPRTAMWRTASGDEGLRAALESCQARLAAWVHLMQSPGTTARLVLRPEAAAVAAGLRAEASLALLGVVVDGLVVNRCPRKSEPGRAAARDVLERLGADSSAHVWRSTSTPRTAPKGYRAGEVLPPIGPTHALGPDRFLIIDDTGDSDNGYVLEIPVAPIARDEVRVGVHGSNLVLAFDGMHAWHPAGSLLSRCDAVDAWRTDRGLAVRWLPDDAVWPARDPGGSHE